MANNNTEYRLQLRSHKEIFPTKEDAMRYLSQAGGFKYNSKFGEPVLLFYGSIDEPKMLVAVGSTFEGGLPSLCYIDDAELRELVAEAIEKAEAAQETASQVDDVVNLLMNTIGEAGLTYDDNKITDKVSYDPPVTDPIIGNAGTLAEAVALISEKVAEIMQGMGVNVEDTPSVTMTNEDGTIKAYVKVHKVDTSLAVNDDNIIGIVDAGNNGGIAASVDISFDSENNTILFKKSGYVNGEYKVDAKTVEIALPDANIFDHAEFDSANKVLILYFTNGQTIRIPLGEIIDVIDVKNDPSSSVVLTKNADNTISGDVKLVDSPSNLIERGNDGKLLVDSAKVALKSELNDTAANIGHAIDDVYADLNGKIAENKAEAQRNLDQAWSALTAADEALSARVEAIEQVDGNFATKQYVDEKVAELDGDKADRSEAVLKSDVLDVLSNNSELPVQSKVLYEKLEEAADAVEGEQNRAEAAESALNVLIDGVSRRLDDVSAKADVIDTVELVKESDLVYNLMVDGRNKGTINIPQDQFFDSASYDAGNKAIVLTFYKTNAETGAYEYVTVSVPVGDLVDTYTAGDGLELNGNEFSVALSDDNESEFLSITDHKLKLSGIGNLQSQVAQNTADIAEKADASEVASLSDKVSAIEGDYATTDDLAAKQDALTAGDAIDLTGNRVSVKTASGQDYSDNMVRVVDDSLYANIKFDVDDTTNTLKYKTSGMEDWSVIDLPSVQLVESVTYNPVTHILTITFSNGDTEEVNMEALVDVIDVDPNQTGPVILSLHDTTVSGGHTSVLSASFDTEKIVAADSAIAVSGNTIYVNAEKLIQTRPSNSLKYDQGSNALYVDPDPRIDELVREMETLKQDVAAFIGTYGPKIDALWDAVFNDNHLEERVAALEELVGSNFVDFTDVNGDNQIDENDHIVLEGGGIF